MKPFSSLLSAVTLAAAGLIATPSAHAVGRLLDVDVIDRDSGTVLPVYRYGGQWWVAGRPGARYAIQARNATRGRVMGVMAVDGVNIISGETAAWNQTGYVFDRRETARITGWRKSDAEVATFNFTALPNSYAARTGRPDNVGVIGVAVFREGIQAPPPLAISRAAAPPDPPLPARASGQTDSASDKAAQDFNGSPARITGQTAPAPASPSPDSLARDKAPAAQARADMAQADGAAETESRAIARAAVQRLGTGHGARENSWMEHVTFERRTVRPEEVITIRYDSRENLVALGVIPADPYSNRRPAPFPESDGNRYVPDP